MSERTDEFQGERRRRTGAPAALLLVALFALLTFTATTARAEHPGGAARRAGLAAEIEARYEVLPARDGVVLRPRSAGCGILAIEVADGEVAIDGVPADEDEVRRQARPRGRRRAPPRRAGRRPRRGLCSISAAPAGCRPRRRRRPRLRRRRRRPRPRSRRSRPSGTASASASG